MNDYELKKLYEEMELHLIKSMKRNLGKHLLEEKEIEFEYPQWQAIKLKELKRYQKENKKIIGRYVLGLEKDVTEHLQNELKQGAINAINQYNNLNKKKLNRNKLMNKSFFKTNDKKIKALIKVVNDDLNIANASALRMINDQYRQIIHKSAFFVGNGVFTEQQAARMAVDEITEKKLTTLAIDEASKNFLAGGLNCIEYKNGRRVNIASYSQMAVRTASLRAQLMGEGDFRKSIGRTLVKVTTHGGACKLCTGWQGKVFVDDVYSGGKADGKHTLLSEAMKQGFLHPNCRHGLTTYYPELEEDEYDEDNNELQEQINYYDRQEKKYSRLKSGSLNSDNIKKYKQKKLVYETKKEEVIKLATGDVSYKDVTNEMLKQASNNTIEPEYIEELYVYTDDGNIKIKYTNENATFRKKNAKEDENKTVKRLKEKLGWNMQRLREVEKPDNVRTPDLKRIINDDFEYWDIKNIGKSETANSNKKKISRAFEESIGQTHNVVIDLNRKDCDLTNEEALNQIALAFKNPKFNSVKIVVLLGKNNLIKAFKR